MYETITVENVKQDILGYLDKWSTEEGSFADSLVGSIAYEIWRSMQRMDRMMQMVCLSEDSGDYVVERCKDYGFEPRKGTRSYGTVQCKGSTGTVLSAGTELVFGELRFSTDAEAVLCEEGVLVPVTAAAEGSVYNLSAGTTLVPVKAISGLSETLVAADFEGGSDPESTEELRLRLLSFLQSTPASGNAADYKKWALTVPGVQNAIVTPLKNGAGTVEVILVGKDNTAVSDKTVAAATAYIEAERPIGAAVTVDSCEAVALDISVTVSLSEEVLPDVAKAQVEENIRNYLATYSGGTLYYSRVMQLCMNADGVQDVAALSVGGEAGDFEIAYNQVPRLGTLEVVVS